MICSQQSISKVERERRFGSICSFLSSLISTPAIHRIAEPTLGGPGCRAVRIPLNDLLVSSFDPRVGFGYGNGASVPEIFITIANLKLGVPREFVVGPCIDYLLIVLNGF